MNRGYLFCELGWIWYWFFMVIWKGERMEINKVLFFNNLMDRGIKIFKYYDWKKFWDKELL